ncbi:hypothetical protein Ddc_17051 [Ditylenchus destructor]|nr:hypothetical protein Ddc_17051 [Ditylenchus destructor]
MYFRTTNIPAIDNETLVEAYKYLKYSDLATNCLVSKRFSNLIRTHRHKLALLNVDRISMEICYDPDDNKTLDKFVFDKKLTPEEYNDWVIRNGYSKHIPFESQVVGKRCKQYRSIYKLSAVCYKDKSSCQSSGSTTVFHARTKFKHKNWPLFQHFVRLLTDPFIYICRMELAPQIDVFNLLAGAIKPDRGRLQCEKLTFDLDDHVQKFDGWIEDNVRCSKLLIYKCSMYIYLGILNFDIANYGKALIKFHASGAHCTPKIALLYYDLSDVVGVLLKKFMDHKISDVCQMVESIRGRVSKSTAKIWKQLYTEFMVKEDEDDEDTEESYEFANNNIETKLQLTVTRHYVVILNERIRVRTSKISLKIKPTFDLNQRNF